MRLIWLVAGLLIIASCGTPVTSEPVGAADEGSGTTTVPTTTMAASTSTEGSPAGVEFDAEAMDRLFPPDRASVVLWALPTGGPSPATLDVRVDGPNELILDESFELAVSTDGGLQLIVDIDLEPEQAYDISVEVIWETTDTTDGGQARAPVPCSMEIALAAGSAWAVTVVPNNGCWWPTVPQWRTDDGAPIDPEELHELSGPAHCEWEHVQFLSVGPDFRTAYARDVDGTFDASWYTPDALGQGGQDTTDDTVGTTGTTAYAGEPLSFAFLDILPAEAFDSGYRNGGRELWWFESGDYAYMRTDSGVERWPLISPRPLCL